jgi:glycosyltransferase involved in cell wall biosynthesis
MLVARFQPDNKIELTLDGYVKSGSAQPFLVVGGYDNGFGAYLKDKYKNCKNIKFIGGVYNYEKLSSLRYFSKLYFHVHSCGGTNPSLLEAMASSAYIAAYKNVFNTYVLKDDGFYYSTADEVARLIENYTDTSRDKFTKANISKIGQEYNWEKVSEEYLRLFRQISAP